MKCQLCDKTFLSTEWYREFETLIVCDECLVEVLKAQKLVKESEIENINRKIKELKLRINIKKLKLY